MSHYIEENCCDYACCNSNRCLKVILAVLGALFTFVAGVLLGAAIAEQILSALAAVIVLAVVLLVLFGITAFYLLCRRCRRKCDC